MPLIELKKLSAGYAGVPVLRDIALTLEKGEIVTLVGANGAGKSTLVKAISGLLTPLSGNVYLDGEDITKLSPADRIHLGIAHIPEGRQIFSGMTVAENLSLGGYATRDETTKARQRDHIYELFPFLRDRLNDVAGNFSGGQQQLLAIARGLMSSPKVLLLDEPSLGVAPMLVAEILRLVTQLRGEGITILLAEQNARQALSIADRGYVFENGAITLRGAAKDLLSSPEIAEKFLGAGPGVNVQKSEGKKMAEDLRALIW
jgi:branched-chain amino acid transport system ATP-binding protein